MHRLIVVSVCTLCVAVGKFADKLLMDSERTWIYDKAREAWRRLSDTTVPDLPKYVATAVADPVKSMDSTKTAVLCRVRVCEHLSHGDISDIGTLHPLRGGRKCPRQRFNSPGCRSPFSE
jgi:hypothetical protein